MKRIVFAAAGVLALVATACGGGDDHKSMNMEEGSTATSAGGAATAKTVSVTMIDIAYEPKSLTVQRANESNSSFTIRARSPTTPSSVTRPPKPSTRRR